MQVLQSISITVTDRLHPRPILPAATRVGFEFDPILRVAIEMCFSFSQSQIIRIIIIDFLNESKTRDCRHENACGWALFG